MIEEILVILFGIGLMTLTWSSWEEGWRRARYRLKTWKASFQGEDSWEHRQSQQFHELLPEHLRRLLQLTLGIGTKKSVKSFIVLSLGLSILCFFIVWAGSGLGLGVFTACVGGILPYLILRCLLQGERVAGSHEGELMVTELLNNYKIYFYNMQQAIEITAITIEDAPHSKKLLLNLSRGLNHITNETQLGELLAEFRYSLNTSWANILANNIHLACREGLKVTASLTDLAQTMANVRQVEEQTKRENNEAGLILKYFIPIGGLFLTLGAIYYFNISPETYFFYQFGTASGRSWFLLWCITYMMSMVLYLLLSRRKFDL